jgi:hypothetical protein
MRDATNTQSAASGFPYQSPTIWKTVAAPDPMYVVTVQSINRHVAEMFLHTLVQVYHRGHMHEIWEILVRWEAVRLLLPAQSMTFPAHSLSLPAHSPAQSPSLHIPTRPDMTIYIPPIRSSVFADHKTNVSGQTTRESIMFAYMCQVMLHDVRASCIQSGQKLCHERTQIQLLYEDSMHRQYCNQRNIWAYHYGCDQEVKSACVVCIHPIGFQDIWSKPIGTLAQQNAHIAQQNAHIAQQNAHIAQQNWEKLSHALLSTMIHEVAHCVMVHGRKHDAVESHGQEWSQYQWDIQYATLRQGIGLASYHAKILTEALQFASEETCQSWAKAWSNMRVQTIV